MNKNNKIRYMVLVEDDKTLAGMILEAIELVFHGKIIHVARLDDLPAALTTIPANEEVMGIALFDGELEKRLSPDGYIQAMKVLFPTWYYVGISAKTELRQMQAKLCDVTIVKTEVMLRETIFEIIRLAEEKAEAMLSQAQAA